MIEQALKEKQSNVLVHIDTALQPKPIDSILNPPWCKPLVEGLPIWGLAVKAILIFWSQKWPYLEKRAEQEQALVS